TALTERGRASEALPRLAAARRVFAELGATTEQVAADLNRGSALMSVGQAEEAYVAADAALAAAGDSAPHLRAFALIVFGDALRKAGAMPSLRDTGSTASSRETSAMQALRDSGPQSAVGDVGRTSRMSGAVAAIREPGPGALREPGSNAALREPGGASSTREL